MSNTITADGQTPTVTWGGGEGTFYTQDTAAGTYGTFTLEYSMDGGTTWSSVGEDTTLDGTVNNTGGNFQIGHCQLRGNLSGSSGANIRWAIERSETRV